MRGQRYSVQTHCIDDALPGQFVFESDEIDEVIGFLSDVDEIDEVIGFLSDVYDTSIVITLFKPRELPTNAVVIDEEMDSNEVYAILKNIVDNDDDAKKAWSQLLGGR